LIKLIPSLFTFFAALVVAATCCAGPKTPAYAVARIPAPLLNTPEFAAVFGGSDGKSLRLDSSGLVREVEFVALPGTPFRIEESLIRGTRTIYRVTTDDYPYPAKTGYFIDSRFVSESKNLPPPRPKLLPEEQKVIANLLAARGSRYVWGGNIRAGIPQLLELYSPSSKSPLPPATKEIWQLAGVDCSGLLYEATNGFTPRNTSSLVEYGRSVPIAGLDPVKIVERLQPLDLIVWSGHVLIVLDRERLIESRLDSGGNGGGVRVRPLREALVEIMKGREPLDGYPSATARGVKGFVIRRWYPDGGR
jgi:cell wall-associated NlpC family hydrolase